MSKDAESWVWNSSATSGNDRLVLLFLADQGDDDGLNSFPSIERIAMKCRVDRDTVRRVINRLEQAGEILVERPARQGRGWFNRYTVVLGRPMEEVTALAEKARDLRPFANRTPQPPRNAEKVAEGGERGAPDAPIPLEPLTVPFAKAKDTRAEIDNVWFPAWWEVYPRKEDKAAAATAYRAAVKKVGPEVLLEAARRYRDDPNRDPDYTKYPATWLHKSSWNNGPLPLRANPRPNAQQSEETRVRLMSEVRDSQ